MFKFYRIASNSLQAIQIVHELFDCPSYMYTSRKDETSLNDSKIVWVLTLFKCVLVSLLQDVVRSLLSVGAHLWLTPENKNAIQV